MHDPNDENFLLSRRTLMLGGAALGAAGLISPPAFAQAPHVASVPVVLPREGLLPADPAARIAMYRRVRLRTDGGMVFWFFRGRNYAQQGANLIPLCELNFGAFMQVNPLEDGGMEVVSYELGFRSALDSPVPTEQIYNPITDQMIDVPFAPVGPTRVRYDAHNTMQLPSDIGGTTITVEHVPEVFYQLGDQVGFQTHTRARAQTPGFPDRVLNDMSLLTAPLAQALDPSVTFAHAWAYGGDVTDYARWLRMPEGAGTQTLRSMGQKYERYEQMPQDWRDQLAAADPAMAADPVGGLNRPPETYRN